MPEDSLIAPLLSQMQRFAPLGRTQAEGAQLIGPAPHLGELAWLHELYTPLTPAALSQQAQQLGLPMPAHLLPFYAACNGFKYFGDTLSLDGFRRTTGRGLAAVHQPYALLTPNVDERLADADEDLFFIGGYDWDGSLLYTRPGDACICLCSPDSSQALHSWPDMASFIASEAERIASLFDAQGVQIDPDASTLPI